jgi:dTDP-4-dehydrorhamnose 3,5-epimerase
MKFTETAIKGAFVIELETYHDDRGDFARTWCQREFELHGICALPVQANMAFNKRKGTLRGLHYQVSPFEEAKLVRCVRGAIFDVLIDLRSESSTFEQWFGIELSHKMSRMIYIPEGCAHGYQTLENETEILYLSTAFYSPESEVGVRWNDPTFKISWPIMENVLISEKDQKWPDYYCSGS